MTGFQVEVLIPLCNLRDIRHWDQQYHAPWPDQNHLQRKRCVIPQGGGGQAKAHLIDIQLYRTGKEAVLAIRNHVLRPVEANYPESRKEDHGASSARSKRRSLLPRYQYAVS